MSHFDNYRWQDEAERDTEHDTAVFARLRDLEAERDAFRARYHEQFAHVTGLMSERDVLRAELEHERRRREEEFAESMTERDALRAAGTRAAAELRHAFRNGAIDPNLVARAIRILEEATTPRT